ncbi:MAG: class I SAM-dependent methyltransferase [Candidatus Eremiobacteraeota bacterium]|nr:class I SAM-dependent methyltransferase [Candidatus Eremiobacteraeota bacterium]
MKTLLGLRPTARTQRAAAISREILEILFGSPQRWTFAVRLWDGTRLGSAEPRFTLVLAEPAALRAAFSPPLDLSPGRAYVEGSIDLEGDAENAVDTLAFAIERLSRRAVAAVALRLARLPKPSSSSAAGRNGAARLPGRIHSPARDAAAIGFHYDQPVAFYRTFLGEDLVYSCAYYDQGVETLEEAQRAKIDYTLRKLRLRPGEKLLDIGCGWGALVIRAAKSFGAKALGITLSRRQYEEARRRIAAAGLEGHAHVELRDYREIDGSGFGSEAFDKIVSIGMVEHVGRSQLRTYFEKAFAALRPGGLFLNHGISEQSPKRSGFKAAQSFMGRYVFPDGELLPVSEDLLFAERAGFEVRDVENLREHYARTLRDWVANLERNREAAIAASDERTYRVWRLYMAGSAQGFNRARMGVFQSLLSKPERGRVALPATRADLYGPLS